ncbi:hypothetical protein OP10G_0614 [Fimbriimonas ginsengisoli Gsoil 348]|uniref:Uncharacterized protein n=2 Tax=Fimbriimonas ginsengisoli TaxID=1005039 RepID=A0A068NKM0_FIMGI|nr:hypothetical protein OP10G_0614 [Fimbriimonas ginsengisoli Gsoil 348]
MLLEVDSPTGTTWEGDFDIVPADGSFSLQGNGEFNGTLTDGVIHATCQALDGTTFDLDGQVTSTGGYRLTRSDHPSEVLQFSPEARLFSQTRASRNFKYQGIAGQINLDSRKDRGNGVFDYAITIGSHPGFARFFTNNTSVVVVEVAGGGQMMGAFDGLKVDNFGTKSFSSYGSAILLGEFEVQFGRFFIGPG